MNKLFAPSNLKFAVGDTVKITSTEQYHGFALGQHVTVSGIMPNGEVFCLIGFIGDMVASRFVRHNKKVKMIRLVRKSKTESTSALISKTINEIGCPLSAIEIYLLTGLCMKTIRNKLGMMMANRELISLCSAPCVITNRVSVMYSTSKVEPIMAKHTHASKQKKILALTENNV